MIRLKRVYEDASPRDGMRVLVERLWPRGLTKERAAVDVWLKAIAPSPELRTWFGHVPARWEEFRERYFEELRGNTSAVRELQALSRQKGGVTLVYAAKEEAHNGAVALKEYLEHGGRRAGPRGGRARKAR